MTAAVDKLTDGGEYTAGSGSPFVFSVTPNSPPQGVVVFDQQIGTSSDHVNGAVTYGGVAMARPGSPSNGLAQDTAVEPAAVVAYFLGSGVPSGTQNVSITHDTGIFGTKWCCCVTLTGAGDLEVVANGKLENDAANPSISLDSLTRVALKLFCLYSGKDAIASITNDAGITRLHATKYSAAACCRVVGHRTTPGTGSETVSQTATSDDAAMLGLAIAEVEVPPLAPWIGGGFFDERDSGLVTPRIWLPGESRAPAYA